MVNLCLKDCIVCRSSRLRPTFSQAIATQICSLRMSRYFSSFMLLDWYGRLFSNKSNFGSNRVDCLTRSSWWFLFVFSSLHQCNYSIPYWHNYCFTNACFQCPPPTWQAKPNILFHSVKYMNNENLCLCWVDSSSQKFQFDNNMCQCTWIFFTIFWKTCLGSISKHFKVKHFCIWQFFVQIRYPNINRIY